MDQPLRFEFRELNHGKLTAYTDFLLRHYRLVDAYWFLKVEDNFGLDVATRFNEEIWGKLGEISTKDIMKYMGVEKGDLKEHGGGIEVLSMDDHRELEDNRIFR